MKQCFSNKLQELRKKNGLSQEALAEILDVSRQSVSKWESGQVYPEIDKIIFLSEYFHVSIDELLRDDIQPQRNRINLSKSVSVQTKEIPPVMEQEDIMPQGYQIPPVQPQIQPAVNNIHVIGNNQSKKKIKPKRKLRKSAVVAIAIIGGISVSAIIAAIGVDIYYDYTSVDYYHDDEIIVEETPTTAIAIIDGVEQTYEYDPYEILNKIYYYYDKNEKQYVEVLLPIETSYIDDGYNSYNIQSANVYLEGFGTYLDVITLTNNEYNDDFDENTSYMRYYSDTFGKYINVLIPTSLDTAEQLSCYGYKAVDVYEDGELYKTIVKDN